MIAGLAIIISVVSVVINGFTIVTISKTNRLCAKLQR